MAKVVAKREGYELRDNGELWRVFEDSECNYMAGYVMDAENLDYAIEMAEEEMRVLMAQAREEFGF
jgi:hypothetical protein